MTKNLPDAGLNPNLVPFLSNSVWKSGKKGLLGFFLLCMTMLLPGFASQSLAQGTTLEAGDVAIIGLSVDPDAFAFVLLRDVATGTVIHFTDNAMSSPTAGTSNEGYVTYTAPSAQAAGTVVRFNGSTGNGWSSISNFALSNSGDNVFAYQGTRTNWASQSGITILYGAVVRAGTITSGSPSTSNTYVPASLTVGTTFIALPGANYTNAYFANQSTATATVTVSGTKAELLSLIGATSNWFGSSSTATYPTWNFTVVTGPSITPSSAAVASMSTTYGTASAARTFTVSASGLSENVTVTAPTGFEVSQTSTTTGFAAAQSLAPSSGTLTNKAVYVRLTATATAGTYSGNVALVSGTASTTKTIPNSTVSAKAVAVTGATAQNKIYDRTTSAAITGATVSGLVNDDAITVTGGGNFTNFDAGTNKPVIAALALSGANASSYTLTQPSGLTADITTKPVSLTNISVGAKIYDGTTAATVTADVSGVIAPDNVTANIEAFFTSPFAGTGIPVNATASLVGTGSLNYTLAEPTGITGDIAQKNLIIANATAQNKVFDGNTDAQLTGTLQGVVAPDEVALVLQGSFESPEVGLNIPVTSTSYITGDIANYTLEQPVGLAANISAEALIEQTITFASLPNATYGDMPFTLGATTSSGLEIAYSSSDESVATVSGNTVTVHNAGTATITANQAGDLTFDAAEPVSQVLTVVQKQLTLASAVAADKIYDATASAEISGVLSGIVGDDEVNFDGTGTFASVNAGVEIPVSANLSISGQGAANYTIAQPSGLFADITPKPLTLTGAQAADKTYDATDTATVSGGTLVGIINGDDVALSAATGTFASVNAGNNIAVIATFGLVGTSATNYTIVQPSGLSADITPREVSVSGWTASDKVYDATTAATISGVGQINGLLGSDEVFIQGLPTATFANKNVGNAKAVALTNLTLSGQQAANYTAVAAALSADITVASLTIANAQAVDKIYDGNTSSTITGTLSGVLGQDNVTLVGTGNFASAQVGNDIAVTSTATLAGTDAANYIIAPQPTGLFADILQGPTVLAPGDLSIIGFQINSPDTFVFVNWVDLYPETVIKFTDNGFLSSASANAVNNARAGENVVIWNSGQELIPAGTVIRIATSTPSMGTIVEGMLTGLATNGDNIFAYQGSATSGIAPDFDATSGTTTFRGTIIYGLHIQGGGGNASWLTSGAANSNVSYLPSELNFAGGNIAIGNSAERGQYNGSRNNKTTFAEYKQMVNNVSNWSTSTSGTQNFNLTAFTLATAPESAVISGNAEICVGANAQFSIAVTGGISPYTVVYSNGSEQFTLNSYVSGSNVVVNPASTTTYTLVSATDALGLAAEIVSGSAVITVNQKYGFYADNDFDGFGSGEQVLVCAVDANTPPVGFSVNDFDCDDDRGSVNPNATEIPFNGIDDDCDGSIDEGSQVFSKVLPAQCGTTLGTISSVIGAVSLGAPIDGYRFKVVNVATGAEQVIDRNVPHFLLTQLAQYDYAATYDISVQLRRNGQWLNYYGEVCQISTPAILDQGGAAAINPSQCGGVLTSISSLIATTSIAGVSGYRFKITDTASNEFQVIDRNVHWFSLTMLQDFLYGRTYSIEVSVRTNGQYSAYGQPCEVTTPTVPQIANCGAVIATKGTLISTTSLNRVTSYRFQLTNLENFVTTTIDRPLNFFSFNNVPEFAAGAQYSVSVALMTSGDWSDFSEACFITAPGSSAISKGLAENQADEAHQIAFRAVLYPNPYSESFAIDMDVPLQESVSVRVYDMVGKLVENREFASDAIEVQQFGESYPSGVYNVIVSQGANVKTLRVIKR